MVINTPTHTHTRCGSHQYMEQPGIPQSLQKLCASVLAKKYTNIREIYMLPNQLQRVILPEYEEKLRELAEIEESIMSFPDLDYCCRGELDTTCLNEIVSKSITNGYFVRLYREHIRHHCFRITYCGQSGYDYPMHAPAGVAFTTRDGTTYEVRFAAETSNNLSKSNWDRLISIYQIEIIRNGKYLKHLPFLFVYDTNNQYDHLSISHIKLDRSMNYVSHYINKKASKSASVDNEKFSAQMKFLLEKQKTSTLPFFVLFLEHIDDPIMRIIYLFTYMPTLKVISGK